MDIKQHITTKQDEHRRAQHDALIEIQNIASDTLAQIEALQDKLHPGVIVSAADKIRTLTNTIHKHQQHRQALRNLEKIITTEEATH